MSKYNNVNPGQYKTAGRERPNTIAETRLKTEKPIKNRLQKPGRKRAKPRT